MMCMLCLVGAIADKAAVVRTQLSVVRGCEQGGRAAEQGTRPGSR